jgi:hypothetical protein
MCPPIILVDAHGWALYRQLTVSKTAAIRIAGLYMVFELTWDKPTGYPFLTRTFVSKTTCTITEWDKTHATVLKQLIAAFHQSAMMDQPISRANTPQRPRPQSPAAYS